MKLKYYLRGLGIGIIVTALLMGYSNKNSNQAAAKTAETQIQTEESSQSGLLADRMPLETENASEESVQTREETTVIETTEEEETTLEQISSEEKTLSKEETVVEESSSEESTALEKASTEKSSTAETKVPSVKNSETESSATADENSSTAQNHDTVTLNIVRGDDSGTVSRKLKNAGVVDNAAEFDAFLMQHGYDKKISIGTVEIPLDATWLEIAEMISGR